MNLTPLACSVLLAVGSLGAQFMIVNQSSPRRLTRVVWLGVSGAQQLSIEHGQPMWRPNYDTLMQRRSAENVPLGSGPWTTLRSDVDVTIGHQKLPRGRWYLGMVRDDAGAWALTLRPADKCDAEGLEFDFSRRGEPDLRVPMRLERDAKPVELLEITLAAKQKIVSLAIAWGTYRLHADLVPAFDRRLPPGAPEFALSPKDQMVTTDSGLQYEKLRTGAGESPKPTDLVAVQYSGWLTDGTPFDSTWQRGKPITFRVQDVVKGFAEGLQLMQPGATYRFTIPPELGYGQNAVGASIAANSTLVFVVTLVGIEK